VSEASPAANAPELSGWEGTVKEAPKWQVSVTLPIEAPTAAEAVARFWAYLHLLGPELLPAYVWRNGDDLAMRPYVLDHEVNLDPEGDDEPVEAQAVS
jgi:hypothetical protein